MTTTSNGLTSSTDVTCQRCGFFGEPRLSPKGPHIQADCPRCGSYIKFVPKTLDWLELGIRQEGETSA